MDVRPPDATPGPVVVVGAGPGIGASVARTFGRRGHRVGLVSRSAERLSLLAGEVAGDIGAEVATASADATDPDQVRGAIAELVATIGAPEVLCFSPIPDIGLIRPVLETRPEDYIASLRLNVGGAAAAVEAVLPAMRARGRGTVLFTTGSAALRPDPARATSAVTTTAASVYIALLRQAVEGTGIRIGHTVVVGPVSRDDPAAHHPDAVAADLWAQHTGEARDFPSVLTLDP